MVKNIFIFSLFMLSFSAKAQLGEPVLATVTYEFVYVDDLNNRTRPVTELMKLQLSQSTSKYSKASFPTSRPSGSIQKSQRTAQKRDPSVGIALAVVFGPGFTVEELFQFPRDNKINILVSKGLYDYQVESRLPKINWKIYEEIKKIGIYTCQKAIGEYAGRSYIAWFTSELPFNNGPWKLSGLPGLILEAKDTKNEILFLYKDCTKLAGETHIETFKDKLIKVNEKTYQRLKEAFEQDPVSTMKGQFGSDLAMNIEVAYRDSTGLFVYGPEAEELIEQNKKLFKAKKYNPIELNKK